jgi:hypothetical protein
MTSRGEAGTPSQGKSDALEARRWSHDYKTALPYLVTATAGKAQLASRKLCYAVCGQPKQRARISRLLRGQHTQGNFPVCGSILVRVLGPGKVGNVKCSQTRPWESAATGSQACPGPAATPAMVGGQRVAARRMERFLSPLKVTQSRDSRTPKEEADAAKRWQLYGAVWASRGVRFSSCLSLFASRRRRRRGEQLCRRGQTGLQTAVVGGHPSHACTKST